MQSGYPHPAGCACSVVLPVYNEEGNIEPLIREISEALHRAGMPFEIICVDDGSTDGTAGTLARICSACPEIRLIRHALNCGQSAALATGFHHAAHELVLTLDADGQNDPSDIPRFLDAMTADTDAVCGVREKRQDTWVRRVSSRIANRFRRMITGDPFSDSGCNFRLMRRSVLRELPVFNGMHRFIPFILAIQGYRVIEIPSHHRPRSWGQSKYGIGNRMWRGLADCFAMRWYRKRAIRGRRLSDG